MKHQLPWILYGMIMLDYGVRYLSQNCVSYIALWEAGLSKQTVYVIGILFTLDEHKFEADSSKTLYQALFGVCNGLLTAVLQCKNNVSGLWLTLPPFLGQSELFFVYDFTFMVLEKVQNPAFTLNRQSGILLCDFITVIWFVILLRLLILNQNIVLLLHMHKDRNKCSSSQLTS